MSSGVTRYTGPSGSSHALAWTSYGLKSVENEGDRTTDFRARIGEKHGGVLRNHGTLPGTIHDFAIRRFHTLNARNYKRRLRTVMKMDGCFHPRWKHRFDVMGLVDLSHHASTARKLARLGHTAKTRHQKRPAETGGRNGASIAKFRTRRPAHICEISRYRAVFVRTFIFDAFETD